MAYVYNVANINPMMYQRTGHFQLTSEPGVLQVARLVVLLPMKGPSVVKGAVFFPIIAPH